ncbi:hypothetical protein DUZ99_13715 [Xylanibacillus composti]|uniref:Uncharacterized protein n=1 Tax=Xylanibacillus composti TaxID=1572762 RepID=A0A8J4H3E3_9BACL|nr:hypothetical protein [Xylanibacillus composti]MDT9726034.1 hypothetical protein [Xylanibacillus composti]GIQ68821.1 hypothetical protein XYCOK13_16450 [Xylanibacillus composti]
MKEQFLVKHAVGGRTFIDSDKSPLHYQYKQQGDEWLFVVDMPRNEAVEEILRWKEELNVFLFHSNSDQPTKKTWFYVKDGPVEYVDGAGQLRITAQSRIEYVPDSFGFKS